MFYRLNIDYIEVLCIKHIDYIKYISLMIDID